MFNGTEIRTRKNNFKDDKRQPRTGNTSAPNNNKPMDRKAKPVTHEIRIDDKFQNVELAGWKVWVNKEGRLIAAPADKTDTTRKFRTFTYEPGILYIVEATADRNSIVYFRTDTFKVFLDKYKISKIFNADPTGVYEGFRGENNGNQYNAYIVSNNGDIGTSDITFDGHDVIVSDRHPNVYFLVDGASIVIFDKVTEKPDGSLSLFRMLITKENILKCEKEIADMIAAFENSDVK